MKPAGLRRRLGKTFLLQAAAISVATVMGIYLSGYILENFLIKEALNREAEHFWSRYETDTAFQLPDTYNLTGYFLDDSSSSQLPKALHSLPEGFLQDTGVPGFSFVSVDRRFDRKLVLVFDNEQVNRLATWFGIVPLIFVLLVLYLSVWVAYRFSQRAVSPVVALAARVNSLDPVNPDADDLVSQNHKLSDEESVILSNALANFINRIKSFVDRERQFTQDASHELRTPLTVIGIAADVLLARSDLPDAAITDISRIKRSARDMQELVEALLLLARESDNKLNVEDICINDVVHREIEQLKLLAADKPVEFKQIDTCRVSVTAPQRVLEVMLGNLLRNALSYTDRGSVDVEIGRDNVKITDSGIGMESADVYKAFELYFRGVNRSGGYGIGLSIVKRLSDRFHWPVEISSRPGAGTTVIIRFPEATMDA